MAKENVKGVDKIPCYSGKPQQSWLGSTDILAACFSSRSQAAFPTKNLSTMKNTLKELAFSKHVFFLWKSAKIKP